MPQAPDEFWKELDASMNGMYDKMIKAVIPVYKKYLTLDDLKEIIKFYETPVGKKLSEMNPKATNITYRPTDRDADDAGTDAESTGKRVFEIKGGLSWNLEWHEHEPEGLLHMPYCFYLFGFCLSNGWRISYFSFPYWGVS